MLLLFYMFKYIILTFVITLILIYLNLKIKCKINITKYYIHLYLVLILFKKNYIIDRKISYYDDVKKLINRYLTFRNRVQQNKYKKKLITNIYKLTKNSFRAFFIKNILFYSEIHEDIESIAIEFIIVNKLTKRSLIYG